MDSGALGPIFELLKGGPRGDVVVVMCAVAAVSNLVLEFSPMRGRLVLGLRLFLKEAFANPISF